MNMGQRIKFFRKRRGMTQTQLAVAAGLPAEHADVRISQYESGERKPKEGLKEALAKALGVNPLAISEPDLYSPESLMHVFFFLEDRYGLHVSKNRQQICLAFDRDKTGEDLYNMLLDWYAASDMMAKGLLSAENYDGLRYAFPGKYKGK